jgi:sulfide dehydrogenase cytochrome subunit
MTTKTSTFRFFGLFLIIVLAAFVTTGATTAVAQDAPGKAKMCGSCHGNDGVSKKDMIPSIAGISLVAHEDYLYAFREEARACTDSKTKAMCANIKKKLTDEEIQELAAYYSALAFAPAVQEFDADKAATGQALHEERCSKCHSDGGSNPEDDASILAGQWMPYLQQSLTLFVSGEREQPEPMQAKTSTLTEAEVEALVHYYASQQ